MRQGEIREMLAARTLEVCQMLLPNGKKSGGEWRAGSVDGDAGKSLGVHLTGDKAGVWQDFAEGAGGDLLDLWAATKGITLAEAFKEAKQWLGIDDSRKKPSAPINKTFKKPSRKPVEPKKFSPPWQWLVQERKLPEDVLKRFLIGCDSRYAHFPFYDPKGDLVMVKTRDTQWTKETEGDKIKPMEAGMKPILFGWQAMPKSTKGIVICEGEIDCMSLAAYGIPALSVPYGAGTGKKHEWIEHEWDNLEPYVEIFLCFDMDKPGRDAAIDVASRLGRHRCRIVSLPHKDPNKCLTEGVTAEAIWECLAKSETSDPTELRSPGHFRSKIHDAFYPKNKSDMGFGMPWKDAGAIHFRPGEVTILAGTNGHGKSLGTGMIVLGWMDQGARVTVASMEFKPHRWLQRIVRQASGIKNPSPGYIDAIIDWLQDKMLVYDVVGTASRTEMLEAFEYARMRYGSRMFVIDNLSKLDIAMDDYNAQKDYVTALCDFAKANDSHVLLVAHMSKSRESGDKPMDAAMVKGSGSITDLVDNVLVWWRNKTKEEKIKKGIASEDVQSQPDGACSCQKQRNGEEEPYLPLWFDKESQQFLNHHWSRPRNYVHYSTQEDGNV